MSLLFLPHKCCVSSTQVRHLLHTCVQLLPHLCGTIALHVLNSQKTCLKCINAVYWVYIYKDLRIFILFLVLLFSRLRFFVKGCVSKCPASSSLLKDFLPKRQKSALLRKVVSLKFVCLGQNYYLAPVKEMRPTSNLLFR